MELTAAEPRRGRLTQLFLDGERAARVDTETFLRSGLRPGDQVTEERLCQLLQDSDANRAKEKALYLLGYRSHSKKELAEKIARAGVGRQAAQEAADRMEELGLIDDGAYARQYAKELFTRKRYGAMRVRQELLRKGIDGELIEEVLAGYGDGDAAQGNIQAVLEKKYPGWEEDDRQRRRAFAALRRMGYSFEDIRQAMGF